MDKAGSEILTELQAVDGERTRRAREPALLSSVAAVKAFQHHRFGQTYADMLASPQFGPAARFFLADLYGPWDYSDRDHQFARVVPVLVRTLPKELLQTLAALARLHALSERLDSAMAQALLLDSSPSGDKAGGARGRAGSARGQELLDDIPYAAAWRKASTPEHRRLQIDLTLQVGAALERFTHMRLLRQSLRLMRAPAQAAGLGALQRFLEVGFDTFKAMNGSDAFLAAIKSREQAYAASLFAGADADADATPAGAPQTRLIDLL